MVDQCFFVVVVCLFVFVYVRTYLPMQEPQETRVRSLGGEVPLEEEIATHSSALAWRIPWTEERGGLQSMGSQRAEHNWAGARWWCGFWNLSSPTETEPGALAVKAQSPNHRTPPKIPCFLFWLVIDNNVEHILMCLFENHVFSFVQCLCEYFVHF